MKLYNLLSLLPLLGSAFSRGSEFVGWYNEAAATLHPTDEATAKQALADIQVDNDEGHAALQVKLAAAALQT